MLGAIISLAGTVIGSKMMADANNTIYRKNAENLKEYATKEQNALEKLRNMDYANYSPVSAAMTSAENIFKRQSRSAYGQNAVMGGTNASAAATKEANGRNIAGIIRDAASQGAAFKQNVENKQSSLNTNVMNGTSTLNAQQLAGKTQAINTAMSGLNAAAPSVDKAEEGIFDYFNKKG